MQSPSILSRTDLYSQWGFSIGSAGKNLPAMQEPWELQIWSPGREDPLEKGTATHSSILAWRMPMDRGAWRATVHGVVKSRTWLSDFHFTMPTFQQEFSLSWGYKNWLLTHEKRQFSLESPPVLTASQSTLAGLSGSQPPVLTAPSLSLLSALNKFTRF